MARLGALRQLDLDHLDLAGASLLGKALRVEVPVARTATEVAAADLPHQISAVFPVVAAQAPFAGVVRKTAVARATIQRQDRVGR